MKRAWYFVSPTVYEAIIYVLLSVVLLLLGAHKTLTTDLGAAQNAGSNLQLTPSDFTSILQAQNWTAVVSTVFFWGMVGLMLALVGWAMINTVIDLYNTYVVSTNFMHPRYFQQSDWWGDYLLHMAVRVVTGSIIIIYVFLLTRFIYPMWLDLFQNILGHANNAAVWLLAMLAVLGFAISMHILVVFFRIWALRARLIGGN